VAGRWSPGDCVYDVAVIRRIHRLRKHRENEARLEFVVAERERQAQEDFVRETAAAMERARGEEAPQSAEELSYQQGWLLRMEMLRRRAEQVLVDRKVEEGRRREVLVAAALEARVVERVAEIREEANAEEERQRSRRFLDEVGSQAWWRRD
jgi:hypothetical protein